MQEVDFPDLEKHVELIRRKTVYSAQRVWNEIEGVQNFYHCSWQEAINFMRKRWGLKLWDWIKDEETPARLASGVLKKTEGLVHKLENIQFNGNDLTLGDDEEIFFGSSFPTGSFGSTAYFMPTYSLAAFNTMYSGQMNIQAVDVEKAQILLNQNKELLKLIEQYKNTKKERTLTPKKPKPKLGQRKIKWQK